MTGVRSAGADFPCQVSKLELVNVKWTALPVIPAEFFIIGSTPHTM